MTSLFSLLAGAVIGIGVTVIVVLVLIENQLYQIKRFLETRFK